ASALAQEVERWLADEPVSAYPEPWWERTRRWARHHRTTATAGIVALGAAVVLLGVLTGLTRQHNVALSGALTREQNAKERADRARARTREALDAMTSQATGEVLERQVALTEEQKKFLTSVLGYYQEFANEEGDDKATHLRVAQAALRVGLIEYRLGR